MEAKKVSDFERGKDPMDAMGLSLRSQIYQAMYDVAMGIPGVLGMEISRDADSDRVFLKIKYVGNSHSTWRREVNRHLGKYIQEDKTPGVKNNYYFEIYPEYVDVIQSILQEDSES